MATTDPAKLEEICVREYTSLRSALERLVDTGFQILLVVDERRRLRGVLTDGDIRRALLKDVELTVSVGTIANKDFVRLKEQDRQRARSLLLTSRFNHVPIVDESDHLVDLLGFTFRRKPDVAKRDIPIVIMAGGKGTRLMPISRIVPKPLMPVGDETILEKIMGTFDAQGFSNFTVVINYKRELIRSYFAELVLPYSLDFIDEVIYGGTAGGLRLLRGKINEPFLLSNCDVIAEINYSKLMDWHLEHKAHLTILGVRKRVDIPHGVVEIGTDYLVDFVNEKPTLNFLIMSGIYVLDPQVLDFIPADGPFDMDQLIQVLRDKNMRVACFPIESGWFDMGQFEEYGELLQHFEESDRQSLC